MFTAPTVKGLGEMKVSGFDRSRMTLFSSKFFLAMGDIMFEYTGPVL